MSLFIDAELRSFAAGQQDEMLASVTRADASTVISDADTADKFILNESGCTVDGENRFTPSAFRKVCSLLCPGSAALIMDLAGMRRVCKLPASCYSTSAATRIFNEILKARFDATLSGYQLLVDKSTNAIVSVVGPQYQILSNADFLHSIIDNTSATGFDFAGGSIIGRWVCAKFIGKTPLCEVVLPDGSVDVYSPGLCFVSSELGDSSVRATHGMARATTDETLWALYPYNRSSSLRHRGRHFGRALTRLLSTVVDKKIDGRWLQTRLSELSTALLGFGKTEDADDRLFRQMVSMMRLLRLEESHARMILRATLIRGKDNTTVGDLRRVRKEVWPSRNCYDLFVSAMRASKRYSPTVGEKLEIAAFRMLGGRWAVRNFGTILS